ncbi:MAG: polyhydroxyalkanoate synthesis repressor PhaR [Pseudomonadota bacterium]
MAKNKAKEGDIVTIKKYANRRLYNTETSSYVTLDNLAEMVKDGREFVVVDAKSSEDITHNVLTQIIVEEESKGTTLLPTSFLRQIISFYGGGMESMVPTYLETSMRAFAEQQDQLREYFSMGNMGNLPLNPAEALSRFDDMARQNVAMFERATRMFTGLPAETERGDEASASAPSSNTAQKSELDALKEQVKAMQDQLTKLSGS